MSVSAAAQGWRQYVPMGRRRFDAIYIDSSCRAIVTSRRRWKHRRLLYVMAKAGHRRRIISASYHRPSSLPPRRPVMNFITWRRILKRARFIVKYVDEFRALDIMPG